MKTHLSHALIREGGDAGGKGGENNARINISRADGESKSFYRVVVGGGGAASARVFPTIIIIRRDNEAREKDDRTKTGIPSTKTIVCTSTMSRRNKRGYRWCPLGKRGNEDWRCGAGGEGGDAGWRVGEADDAANSIEMHKNRSFQLKITVVAWMAG